MIAAELLEAELEGTGEEALADGVGDREMPASCAVVEATRVPLAVPVELSATAVELPEAEVEGVTESVGVDVAVKMGSEAQGALNWSATAAADSAPAYMLMSDTAP